MIFPIGDDQVKGGYKPIFSYSFLVLNIVVFLIQLTHPSAFICEFGAIPSNIVQGENLLTLFTSMFMHGGWMHLIGNMLFLWVFADNIEATIGNFNFLLFYLLGGLAATAAHIWLGTGGDDLMGCCMPCSNMGIACGEQIPACSGSIPTVGASGAISAVLGAYIVMFPKSKVKVLVIYFFSAFRIAAIWFLGFWILQQLFNGFVSLGPDTAATSGVAWWAHIGGFAFGVVAGWVARKSFMGKAGRRRRYDPKDLV